MSSYLITGAARGIGFEFVRNLSSANPENTVFALVRSLSNSQRLAELQLKAKNIHILEADITDVAALKIAAAAVQKITGGSLDYLINNGALIEADRRNNNLDGYPEGQEDILEKDLTDSFHVNVVGVVHTINVFLPLIRKGTAKKVITISSGMADVDFALQIGLSNQAPYSISKAAVNMVVAKYAAEYKAEGIVFVAVCPGLVDTAATAPAPRDVEEYEGMVAYFRTMKPDFEGAMTPEKSVSMLLGLVHKWTVEDTGSFVSHYGNKDWL
ncbi:NAD(P)-binding protein [Athelia psychrophila]|uniref:NAD(P)-binding protein n=1 Tax=Athelia psychrophila TaxID=1759441 RepID=A0A166SWK4_9AGAM|nr:NAD(P)-binding protein [Fibularhizoctonia sp. CBS 109695]